MAKFMPRNRIVSSKSVAILPFYTSQQSSLSIIRARCSSTSNANESNSNPDSGISKELDATDPDSIYAKVKFEEQISNEDTKGHDGIASSPDHFSSFGGPETDETISDRIKKRIGDIFAKK